MTTAQMYTTMQGSTARLAAQPAVTLEAASFDGEGFGIYLDPAIPFQPIIGFGGAFTESAAVTLGKLSPERQRECLQAYFHPTTGNGYTFGRCHIGSCDFSLGNYHYTETPDDLQLKDFSIDHDRDAIIPMVLEAQRIAGMPLTLFASPWSPPAWMKTTGEMNNGGQLRPECRAAWAQMYVRFIQAYAEAGIPIWGLSVQNEAAATQIWDSCVYSAEEEAGFVRDYLGPALEQAQLGDVKIMIWDHNRNRLVQRAAAAMADPATAKYIWGFGFHWYEGDNFENVRYCRDAWPDKQLVFTEGCQEGGPHDGSWALGERYGRSIIQDLNNGTTAWCDWNLLLDATGGPNHVGNLCSAPILADTENDALRYQNSYYYLGHFSRFIRPGAKRILCASTHDDLECTAAVNADGSVVLVVMNRSADALRWTLRGACGTCAFDAAPHSITTFVLAD